MPGADSPPRIVRFGNYEVDLPAGHLRKRGVKIRLREQSFEVLAILLEHAGEVVTREDLRRRLWPEDVFVDFDNNLNTAIARLREALNDSAEHPRFIETLPKRGYRFIASVSKPAAPRARLVVLPFANLSGDPAQEYFSDAMTEEIIGQLAGLAPEHLAVIARTTAMHYKGSQKDIARDRARVGRGLRRRRQRAPRGRADRSERAAHPGQATRRTCGQTDTMPSCAKFSASRARSSRRLPRKSASLPRRAARKPTEDLQAYNLYHSGPPSDVQADP